MTSDTVAHPRPGVGRARGAARPRLPVAQPAAPVLLDLIPIGGTRD